MVFERIVDLLDREGISYRLLEHEPTYTSEASARVRGEALEVGAKALLVKVGGAFSLFVLSAAKRIDAARIRRALGVKRIRFAQPGELKEITGLEPGAVPPFGRPIFDLDLYVDPSLVAQTRIAFNAGSLTRSIVMKTTDYLEIAQPVVLLFSDVDPASA